MNNSVYFYKIIIVLFNFINLSKEQRFPNSPCPDIFSYAYDGDQLIGKLTIPLRRYSQIIDTSVKLSYGVRLNTNFAGALELSKSREQSANDAIYNHILNYRIIFPVQHSIPLLTQVAVGSNVICTGSPAVAAYVTTISLKHSLFIGNDFTDYIDPSEPPYEPVWPGPQSITPQDETQQTTQYFTQQISSVPSFNPYEAFVTPAKISPQQIPQNTPPLPQKNTHDVPQRFPNPPTNHLPFIEQSDPESEEDSLSQIEIDRRECGRSKDQITDLIYKGYDINHGEFPWLVAIYEIQKSGKRDFFCGGVLVSANVVLTAAHCVQAEGKIRKPRTMLVYLGGHNIQTGQDDKSIIANVNSTFVHEDYKRIITSADADLAFIELKIKVKYNEYIRPICLWSGSNDIQDLIGKNGTVVGWGRDESNALTATPKKIAVPIVSEAECLRSSTIFSHLTSSRTFCAGARNEGGPCHGDSGSGLYIYRNRRWELRGLVSSSLKDPVIGCDLRNFVVYTDVTKYPIIDYITYIINT